MTSSPRPSAAVPVAPLLAVLLAGCGAAEPSAGPSGSSSTTRSASSPASPPPTAAPVVLTRSGGLAGFADRLVVSADGRVTGATRSGAVDCGVDAALHTALATAAVPTPAPAAGTDRMAVTLTRDGAEVDLGEAQGDDPLSEAARTLLDDVQQPEDQRATCRR